MDDLDKKISEALSVEDRNILNEFEEQGLIGQFRTVFQGKMGWVSIASLIVGAAIQLIFFYAAWKFFTVPELDARVFWGAVGWFTAMMVAFMKVWFWMRMESNRVLREVKRLELQVARLNGRS